MYHQKKVFWSLVLIFLMGGGNSLLAQNKNKKENSPAPYKMQMQSLQRAIRQNFYDSVSGNYFAEVDPARREVKNNYRREYTYLWSLCALYQAANEIEKLEPHTKLMAPLLKIMYKYYNPAPPSPGFTDYIMDLKPGERYYDDNEWVGITAINAYKRKKQKSDLALCQTMYDFMMTGYDQVLDGGLYWKEGATRSKNTCSNGPAVLVALQLYQATKNKSLLDTALLLYNWTNEKLQTPSKLFYDNIQTKDGSLNKTIYSYNTGTMLEANVLLYQITGSEKYKSRARAMADESLRYFYGEGRFRDGYWFNAVLLRAYQRYLQINKDTKYILGFKKCLDKALANDKNRQGLFMGENQVVRNLVEQGGMLEILARFAWLETRYDLKP